MATETTKITYVEGAAASTPAATRVTTYAKADGLMYSKDDAGAETLMSSGPATGIAATIVDAKGDIIAATAADTVSRLAVGANNKVLMAASGETTGLKWAFPFPYWSQRLIATIDNASETHNVNSTSYLAPAVTQFYFDFDIFPATHFHISCFGGSTTAAQTITWQLTTQAAPTNPVSAGGDDLVVTNTAGAFTSGWIAISDALSGLTLMAVSRKGSDGTVDFSGRWLDIAFKIA